MKKLIIIADYNDADYITNIQDITEKELNLIQPVIDAIKAFKPYKGKSEWDHGNNYPSGDCCREDLGEKSAESMYGHLTGFEMFNDMVPRDEYYGLHTIKHITLLEVSKETKLL